MKNLLSIPETQTEPFIEFSRGTLIIRGKSIPTDSAPLYNQVIDVFYQYSKKPLPETNIIIDLAYINCNSSRSLLNLLIVAEHMHKEGFGIKVIWYHNEHDELMHEQGLVFKDLLSVPVEITSFKR